MRGPLAIIQRLAGNKRRSFNRELRTLLAHRRVSEQSIYFWQWSAYKAGFFTQTPTADRAEFLLNALEWSFWINDTKVGLAVDPHLRERNRVFAKARQMGQKVGITNVVSLWSCPSSPLRRENWSFACLGRRFIKAPWMPALFQFYDFIAVKLDAYKISRSQYNKVRIFHRR
jgi:hypothetical protein